MFFTRMFTNARKMVKKLEFKISLYGCKKDENFIKENLF